MFFDGSKFDFEDCSGKKKYTLCKQASKYLHAFAAIDFFSMGFWRNLEGQILILYKIFCLTRKLEVEVMGRLETQNTLMELEQN